MLKRLSTWLAAVLGRDAFEDGLDEEVRFHIQQRSADLVRRGVPPADAERRARIAFGSIGKHKDLVRESFGLRFTDELRSDTRLALRRMRAAPGYTVVVIATLALGIGATSAMFSVLDAVLLRALPYRNPSQLVQLVDSDDRVNGGFLKKDLVTFAAQVRSLEGIAPYFRDSGYARAFLTIDGEPEQVQGAWVDALVFPTLAVPPELGRVFGAAEERARTRVAVLSHGLWIRRFGGASDVLGKVLDINGAAFQVIGVMPEAFQFPARDQVFWAPMTTNPYWNDPDLERTTDTIHTNGFFQRWQVIGRLRPGVTVAQAQADAAAILRRVSEADPDRFRSPRLTVVPLAVEISSQARSALAVLFVAVCCVLLIACTNVASLVLARGVDRTKEIAIRTALGAGRARVVRQLVVEGFMLSVCATAAGLALAFPAVRLLTAAAPGDLPRIEQAGISLPVVAFGLVLALVATLAVSAAPALQAGRRPSAEGLDLQTRGATASLGLRRLRGLLIVAEFALALTLLMGAGLLLRSLMAVESVDPGFDAHHVLALRMTVPHASAARLATVHDAVLERVAALAGVRYVGAVNDLFEPTTPNRLGLRAIDGRPVDAKDHWTALTWKTVSGEFFQAMGASLLKGRYFNARDTANSPLVAVIDDSMARRYWPGGEPLGARIKGQDPRGSHDDWVTIVGVVRDMRRSGLEYDPSPHVFEWYKQSGPDSTENIVASAAGDPRLLAASLRRAVRAEDASAVLSGPDVLDDLLSTQLAPRRFEAWLLGLFSAIALILASIGIYGVMHYSVSQRRQEIGVRMALGARPADVLLLVERQGLELALAGVAIGAVGAAFVAPLMSTLLFGVRPFDPLTVCAVVTAQLGIAVIACSVPARQAARVDPVEVLR